MILIYCAMAIRSVSVFMATLLAIMIATSGGLSFFTTNNANATMNGNMMRPGGTMGPGMMIGNQNQSNMMMQMVGAGQNVTGSINLFSTVSNAIETQVKVSLSDAASAAEGAVGNSSHAVAANIGVANGYLIYCVWVLGPGMNMNMVIVDPGNGQVLSNTQISLQHLMMMGMGPGMMGMGPGMMGSGMMSPGMGMGMMGPGMMR